MYVHVCVCVCVQAYVFTSKTFLMFIVISHFPSKDSQIVNFLN